MCSAQVSRYNYLIRFECSAQLPPKLITMHIVQSLVKRLCLPFSLLLTLVFTQILAACGLTSQPPATLRVQLSTPIPTDPPPIPPTPTVPVGLTEQRPFDPSLAALMDEVQNDRLMFTLSALTQMQTRHVLSKKDDPAHGIGAARDWLLGQFNEIRGMYPAKAIDVWTQPVLYSWRQWEIASENVVAVYPGTNVGAGVVVIGAHYDSV
jgi:hypothetical protein